MSGKRTATSDLNADNWNQEDESEEAGTFVKASEEVISRRIVKAAKRRIGTTEGTTRSAFGSFTGFKASTATNSASPFSFIRSNSDSNSLTSSSSSTSTSKPPTTNGSIKIAENGIGASVAPTAPSSTVSKCQTMTKLASKEKESASPKRSSAYYAKLKGLNQSVAQWIKTHVDSNPVCILTPIFRDYEKYLKEIELKHGKEVEAPKVAEKKPETKLESKSPESPKSSGSEEKKSIFTFSSSNSKPASEESKPVESSKPFGSEDKKSIFEFFSSSSKLASEKQSIFGYTKDSSKQIFSATKSDNKCPFGVPSAPSEKFTFAPKASTEIKKEEEPNKSEEKTSSGLSFPSTTSSSGIFSFGQSSATSTASAGFSFGSDKPFSFGAAIAKSKENEEKKTDNEEKEDEDDEPPKPDFKPVTEEGSIYEQKCKVFVKKDGKYSDRGVGTLFLKPAPNDKMQLIVRAINSLGNILLNTLLTESIPLKRLNKTNIMLVCLPLPTAEPPPTATLLRVKTPEEADALFEALEKHRKE